VKVNVVIETATCYFILA